ncbi:MAG TPA: metal-dependent phosphohydrolase, partial [Streptosporangiaceae bacterium]
MSRLSRAAWLYMAVVVTAAVLLLANVLVQDLDLDLDLDYGGSGTLLVLAVLFMICDSTPTTLTSRQSAWSPSSAATLAAVVLLGPGGAALVGATSLISLRR